MSTTLLSNRANHRPSQSMTDSRNITPATSHSQTCRLQRSRTANRRRNVPQSSLTSICLFFTALLFASLLLTKADAAQPIVATSAPSTTVAPASTTRAGAGATSSGAPANANASTTAAPGSFFVTTSLVTSAVTNSGRVSMVTNAVNITLPIASSTSAYTSTPLSTVAPLTTGPLAGTQAAPAPIGGSNALGPNDNYIASDGVQMVSHRSKWLPVAGSALAVVFGFGLVL